MSSGVALQSGPTMNRREKRVAETRARIEEAAYSLFRSQGIEAVSIEMICERADVARRTFYSHFANKHSLIGALGVDRVWGSAAPMLQDIMMRSTSVRNRLNLLFEMVDAAFQNWDEIDRELILWAPSSFINGPPQQQQEIAVGVTALFERLVEDSKSDLVAPSVHSSVILATSLIGTLNTLTLHWAIDPNFPISKRLKEAKALFEQLICSSEK
jgi:AcrR family transcriptional regulator